MLIYGSAWCLERLASLGRPALSNTVSATTATRNHKRLAPLSGAAAGAGRAAAGFSTGTAATPGSAYVAGGTNLLDLMKGNITRPDRLVDINRLPELNRIEQSADDLGKPGVDLVYSHGRINAFRAVTQ